MIMARVLPRPGIAALRMFGREYPVAGTTVDVPFADAATIGDQGIILELICLTADRPSNRPGDPNYMPTIPPRVFDSDLGAMIYMVPRSFPLRWVDLTGTAV